MCFAGALGQVVVRFLFGDWDVCAVCSSRPDFRRENQAGSIAAAMTHNYPVSPPGAGFSHAAWLREDPRLSHDFSGRRNALRLRGAACGFFGG